MKLIGRALVLAAAGSVLLVQAPATLAQKVGLTASLGRSASPAPALSVEQASERFKDGESYERRQQLRFAFEAYAEAGEAGHPLAQKKLGDFYSTGNAAVDRDYERALRWYQKARAQGVEIPAPHSYSGAPYDGRR